MSTEDGVDWNGRTYGELTPDEKRKVNKVAMGKLQAELERVLPAILDDMASE